MGRQRLGRRVHFLTSLYAWISERGVLTLRPSVFAANSLFQLTEFKTPWTGASWISAYVFALPAWIAVAVTSAQNSGIDLVRRWRQMPCGCESGGCVR